MKLKYSKYSLNRGLQRLKTKTAIVISAIGLVLGSGAGVSIALLGTAHAVTNTVIYNSIPNPTPGNVVSMAFEATSTSEFGAQVQFDGTARQNPTVTVLMSSWGCESGNWFANNCSTTPGSSFSEPITLNIYTVNADNSVGPNLFSTTQTFNVPFRPSADNEHCTGADAGKWFSVTDSKCYNGFATPVTFSLNGTLPNKAIITVAYNTSDFGAVPYGDSTACHGTAAGCGYDSLNVGLVSSATVGTNPVANSDYLNSLWGGAYCDNGTKGVGSLRFDTGSAGSDFACPLVPAINVSAQANMPTSKNQCMKDGWKNYGTTFKNQGDCVSFVATGGKNQPSGQ